MGDMALPGTPGTNLQVLSSEVERAVVSEDIAVLKRSRQRLAADVADHSRTAIKQYTLAYINWRLTYLLDQKRHRTETEQLLDEAETQLHSVLKAQPSDAEALALLGAIYAARIAHGSSAMKFGPKASEQLSEAARLSPNNPRVALLRGIHLFFTPWPNWGHADALIWLGQVLAKKREYTSARAMYERALALEPNHAWARTHRKALESKLQSR